MSSTALPVIQPAPEPPLPWSEMIEIEPRLGAIIDDAELLGGGGWDDFQWYALQLSRFVGWDAGDARLSDPLCYTEATRRLTEALGL